MTRSITLGFCAIIVAALGGCTPDYSPDTYNSAALQQANKVDTGIVVGYRQVKISVDGTIGAVTGGAAGGILGAQADTSATALAALGGTVVGGVIGNTVEHATGDTTGWEYIVREPKGELVSVTQREPNPLPIGQKVLVIEGKQARIVPDYASTAYDARQAAPPDQSKAATNASAPSPETTPSDAAASAAAASAAPATSPTEAPPAPSAGSDGKPAPPPPS